MNYLMKIFCYFAGHRIDIELGEDMKHDSWYTCVRCGYDIRSALKPKPPATTPTPRGPCGYRWHAPDCNCGGAGGDR